MDVQDTRKNNWAKRSVDPTGPKTIEQIHKEAADEKVQNQQLVQRMSQEKRGQPKQRQQGPTVDEHGFQTVRPNKIDHSQLRIPSLRGKVDENSIQLGPQTKYTGWGKGSTGGGRNASQEADRPQFPSNRFSALSDGAGSRQPPMGPPRFERQSAGGGKQQFKPAQQRSQERERSEALKAAREITEAAPVAPATVEKKTFTDYELKTKTVSVLEEYFHLKDINEAKDCVKELEGYYLQFVDKAVNCVLERSSQSRNMTGVLFVELLKSKIISMKDYVEGLKQVLEFADDMSIDIPKIWTYLAEIISPILADRATDLSILKDLCTPLPEGKGPELVAETLNDATHRLGHIAVADIWHTCGLTWLDFGLAADKQAAFIASKNLDYLVRPVEIKPAGDGKVEEKTLLTMMKGGSKNDDIFDYIDGTVGLEAAKEPKNIKILMTAVCKAALEESLGKVTVSKNILTNRRVLLLRYMDHNLALEIDGLYALQLMVNEMNHPSGLLREFFDLLYDEDVISEDAFNAWNTTDKPAEKAGYGVAKAGVAQFFTWLHNAEPEADV
jgi:translation initiation factor 4G